VIKNGVNDRGNCDSASSGKVKSVSYPTKIAKDKKQDLETEEI